ncbi:carboxylesterase/lipase family protein [Cryobacterium sp. TMT2-14]|nr:carboxylesterase/lipase family protein [Cryobacterium sp. TMT2-14]
MPSASNSLQIRATRPPSARLHWSCKARCRPDTDQSSINQPSTVADSTASLVHTPDGILRGRVVTTPDGVAAAFRGIPYRVATQRFRPGRLVEPWKGTRDAIQAGPASPQHVDDPGGLLINERDCLNLNVWTPDPSAHKLPVFVWIHGGLHISGSNADPLRDGVRLAASGGIVVVSINYRLGALGYLTLDHLLGPDYSQSGNLALVDIISALEWVRDSIAQFGGDPLNVTVAGQSAGATMVATLLASPRAAGLMRRAIVQSGDPERVGSRAYGEAVTDELLDLLHLGGDPAGIIDLPWSTIIRAQQHLLAKHSAGRPQPVPVFRPSIDGRLLLSNPVAAVAGGASAAIDLIVGTNLNEASGHVDLRERGTHASQAVLDGSLSTLLSKEPLGERSLSRFEAYRDAFQLDTGRGATPAELLEACLTDTTYRQPSQRLLDARTQATGSTRSYLFVWEQQDATWARGAGHSIELPSLFRHVDDSQRARAEAGLNAPYSLRDVISQYWVAFATTGALDYWPEYEPNRRSTLILDSPTRLADAPRDNIRRLADESHMTKSPS